MIAGTECVILANDPSVLGGALTPYAAKKWMRALEIARDNRIPYVSFVESAGADLRGSETGGERQRRRRSQTDHFAETGRFFYEMIELSKLRDPHGVRGLRLVHRGRRLPARACPTTTIVVRSSRRSSWPVRRS